LYKTSTVAVLSVYFPGTYAKMKAIGGIKSNLTIVLILDEELFKMKNDVGNITSFHLLFE
jgi:hypothetical protein